MQEKDNRRLITTTPPARITGGVDFGIPVWFTTYKKLDMYKSYDL